MRITTLCYLVDKDRILLGLKKRGFGCGRWNGYGGKKEPSESIEEAALRELKEEMSVEVSRDELKKVAVLDFSFTKMPEWDQQVHVFFIRKWKDEPKESEEMKPQWFNFKELPLEKMWADDPYWLRHVFDGKKVKAEFTFAEDNSSILKHNVRVVHSL